jgi:PAS domain S-box-containing protein
MGASQLGIEGKGLRYKLLVIEALVFVLPFLALFYLVYDNKIFLNTDQLLIIGLILVLILSGLVILRRIFDKLYSVSNQFADTYDNTLLAVDKERNIDELNQISLSFRRLMDQLQTTSHELKQRVFELLSIRELNEVARKSLDVEALMDLLLQKAVGVSGAQTASILMVEHEKQQFRVAAARGAQPGPGKNTIININDSILQFVLDHRTPLLVENIETDERIGKANNPRYDTPSFLSMPLFVKGDIVAVLNLSDKETKETFDANDRDILSTMINEITFALENAQLHSKIASQLSSIEKKSETLSEVNAQLEQEVSERLATENELRESEARYRQLVENAGDAIFILQNDRIIFSNPKTEELTGRSVEELTKLPFEMVIHPDDRGSAKENHHEYVHQTEASSPYTFRIQVKNGETRWVQSNSVSISWNEKPAELYFLRDITRQRKLEDQVYQAQKMESIGTLAGGIAHEFNNLLMAILGNANIMMLDVSPPDPVFERLKGIEISVQRGAHLTRQLLGFARGGKYEIKIFNVNGLISRTAKQFGKTRKEVKIRLSLQEDLRVIEADANQLEQMVMNLYMNAWQAMPDGGILMIESENVQLDEKIGEAKPGSYVKITITDTGVGMDEKTRQRIFEPFFTTKENGEGSGLGLAAVYGIVKNHGGHIDVSSEQNKRTTFQIYLPASENKILQETPTVENLPELKATLLLVDDETIILEVTQQMLERLGYHVLVAKSGSQALELYSENQDRVDAVILDMTMPNMSGGETFDRLMGMNPEIKVLLSSGYSIDGKAEEILARGCKGFIQKPFAMAELSRRLRQLLDGSV